MHFTLIRLMLNLGIRYLAKNSFKKHSLILIILAHNKNAGKADNSIIFYTSIRKS